MISKLVCGIFLFFVIFTANVIVIAPVVIGSNAILYGLYKISYPIRVILVKAVEIANWLLERLIPAWNGFVTYWNSLSTVMPVVFMVWNKIVDIVTVVGEYILATFCTTPFRECISQLGPKVVVDLIALVKKISVILSDLISFTRTAIENGVCEPVIAARINFTIPLECQNRPLTLTNYLEYISALIKFIVNGDLTVSTFLADFFCNWCGECGLMTNEANTLPHEFPTQVKKVSTVIEIISRSISRPAIISNAILGFLLNIIVLPVDAILCTLLPQNFVGCVFGSICNSIFKPFKITVLPRINLVFFSIGPIEVTIDIGALICLKTYTCSCLVCANNLNIPGPCKVHSDGYPGGCPACIRANTIFDELWYFTATSLNPELGSSPVTGTSFTSPIRIVCQVKKVV